MLRRNFFKYLAGLLPIPFLAKTVKAEPSSERLNFGNIPIFLSKRLNTSIETSGYNECPNIEYGPHVWPICTLLKQGKSEILFINGQLSQIKCNHEGEIVTYDFRAEHGLRSIATKDNITYFNKGRKVQSNES